MPTVSLRQQILDALKDRLEEIRPGNGYETDAGLRVFQGRVALTEDDTLPVIALVPGDATVVVNAQRIKYRLPVTAEALTLADAIDPLVPAEALLADLKRALFRLDDRTLDGLVVDVEYGAPEGVEQRADGGTHVAARVTAVVTYMERYGDPTVAV
jgi:hypothetical protein